MNEPDGALLQMVRRLAIMPVRDREIVLGALTPGSAEKLTPILTGLVQEKPSVRLQHLLKELGDAGNVAGITSLTARALTDAAQDLAAPPPIARRNGPQGFGGPTGVLARVDGILARLGMM